MYVCACVCVCVCVCNGFCSLNRRLAASTGILKLPLGHSGSVLHNDGHRAVSVLVEVNTDVVNGEGGGEGKGRGGDGRGGGGGGQ